MKLFCIILSFTILFAGCYSQTTVTKDTPNLDNEELTFTLTDNSYIISKNGQHQRVVDNGYEIVGELRHQTSDSWHSDIYQRFDGIVVDEQIQELTIAEFDIGLTVITVGVAVPVVVGMVWLVFNWPPYNWGGH